MIKIADVGAAPHNTEPTKSRHVSLRAFEIKIHLPSNARIERIYANFGLRSLWTLPKAGWKAVSFKRYAEPYHPTSLRALNSVAILGIAMPTIVVSIATSSVPRHNEVIVIASGHPLR